MSTVGLFLLGTFVTLIVAFAVGICIWGAILDGRTEREYKEAEGVRPPVETRPLTPAA